MRRAAPSSTIGGPIGTDEDILFTTGFDPDTDGDGLNDGEEVSLYSTDPDDAIRLTFAAIEADRAARNPEEEQATA